MSIVGQFYQTPDISRMGGACGAEGPWASFTEIWGRAIAQFIGTGFWLLAASLLLVILARAISDGRWRLYLMSMTSGGCAAGLISSTNRYLSSHEPFLIALGVALAIGCGLTIIQALKSPRR